MTVVPILTSASHAKRGPTVVEIPGGVASLTKTSVAVRHQVTTLDRANSPKESALCHLTFSAKWRAD
jgi:mRNA-degrading endonuclease toxin of MazEF toxin-antitoxin module